MKFSRACGTLLHPTSLPGPLGSGDFGAEAYRFVDWLARADQSLWQVLPLGGIGPGNSPYMSSSAFAGNPLLIDLTELQERGWLQPGELETEAHCDQRHIDFTQVVPFRMQRLEVAAQRFAASATGVEQSSLRQFCDQQAHWLDDYALFMALAEGHPELDWCDWDTALVAREPAALEDARARLADRIAFWEFCQWCFFRQWQALHFYANARGVKIIGDAPIFVAYHSADVWSHQQLFELDADRCPEVVAGVPPDYFSASGQLWGNPLYRWESHREQDYAWWVERIRHSFDSFDMLRIDHFLGFVNYWEIPADAETAIDGRWRPGPGAELFETIGSTLGPLAIIAEDLGTVTPEVHALREKFGFPGMAVLQFAWGSDNDNPHLPHNHARNSVVYTGTHDNDTALGWWESLDQDERDLIRDYLHTEGRAPNWDLIQGALRSRADTAIIPLQDYLGLDSRHRMNTPGEPRGNWRWRFLWTDFPDGLAERITEQCRECNRSPVVRRLRDLPT